MSQILRLEVDGGWTGSENTIWRSGVGKKNYRRMSVRLLKKVLKEKEAEREQEQLLNSGDGESDSPDSSSAIHNPFDLLIDEYNENHDFEQGDKPSIAIDPAKLNDEDTHLSISVNSSNHKVKKKKKKKGKLSLLESNKDHERLSDLMFEDLSIGVVSSRMQCVSSTSTKSGSGNLSNNIGEGKKCWSSILHVDPRYLIAENELRRIFGSKVVSSFGKSHQIGNSRQSRGTRRGNHNHRRSILVSPSEHWPRWDGSLSMELLETKDGFLYFRYLHSSSYSQSQKAFEAAKEIHDLNGIANVLMYRPYHMDSLIALAEYFKFSGEHQMSAEAIAKCLYGLECAWHSMFTPLQSNCQLKYVHETNRPFFSALFTHMKDMDMRGCHRSALEICKLLLSLDSDDPLGVIFCIDYYALRAEEYSWLEHFSEEYDSNNSLWLFPNFAYSLAVCRFFREQQDSEDTEKDNRRASSCDLMKQALMLYPSVLIKLVDKVPLKGQIWTSILKNSLFVPQETGSPSLDHLINIYVERSHLIWRLPGLQLFLKNSASLAIETLNDGGAEAKDWTCVRKEAFSSDKNEYDHLRVSDFSDSVPTMAPEDLQNFMIDHQMGEENNIQVMNPPVDARDLSDRNPLLVLLESMLPWTNYGVGNREDDHNDQHDGGNERVE